MDGGIVLRLIPAVAIAQVGNGWNLRPLLTLLFITIHMERIGSSSDQFSVTVSIDVGKMNGRVILRLLPMGGICTALRAIGERTTRCQLLPAIRAWIIVPDLDSVGPTPYQFSLTVSVDVGKLDGGVILWLIPVRRVA